ncbi:MAG: hypothetical protein MI867_02900 [Pseudomonadales bacterium]|nr:hypothetical protein [Pseudomonadales bacterium]
MKNQRAYKTNVGSLDKFQKGASTVEYVVVSLMVVGVMFSPVFNGRSAIDLLVAAIKLNYSGYAWGMSVPI